MEVSNGFVIVMGIGVVFAGLISIIILCSLMGLILRDRSGNEPKEEAVQNAAADQEIPQKQQFIAAVSAVIAEELGKDISAIRIHSVKKL